MSWINTSLANSSGVASWSTPRADPKLPNEPDVNGERGVVALSGTGNVEERGERSKRERSGDKRVWNMGALLDRGCMVIVVAVVFLAMRLQHGVRMH